MKNGPIDKILRIQLGLYIRKPGKKSLTQKELILMRGIAFEKMARVAWKMAPKYQQNAKWSQITFRGLILVPEVAFGRFLGLVCIKKWSRNFDLGTQSAIFSTPKMTKITPCSAGARSLAISCRLSYDI